MLWEEQLEIWGNRKEEKQRTESEEKRKMDEGVQRERVLQKRKKGKITATYRVTGRIKAEDGKQARTEKLGMQ